MLFTLMDDIPVYFHVDALGRLFAAVTGIVWLITGIYAFLYMKHEGEEKRFFGFTCSCTVCFCRWILQEI